jgi:hypothetical protein
MHTPSMACVVHACRHIDDKASLKFFCSVVPDTGRVQVPEEGTEGNLRSSVVAAPQRVAWRVVSLRGNHGA